MKLNKFKLIWMLLTNKHFAWLLDETIQYAINNCEEKRGCGASDAMIFSRWYKHLIFKSS